MSLPKTDAFTAADGTSLTAYDAGWVNHTPGSQTLKILGNAIISNTVSTDTYYYWNTDTPNAAQYAQSNAKTVNSQQGYMGPGCRIVTATKPHGYWIESANGDRGLYVDGASAIYSDAGALASGDIQRLEVSGSTLTYKVNGSAVNGGGTTDSTYASAGKFGIYHYDGIGNTRQDDFEGGNLAGGGSTTTLTPAAATLTLSAQTPKFTVTAKPAAQSLSLSAKTTTLTRQERPAAQALTLSAQTPKFTLTAKPVAQSLSLTGQATKFTITVKPSAQSLVLAPKTTTLTRGERPAAASLSLSAQTPTFRITVKPTAQALVLTGRTSSLTATYKPAKQSLVLTGSTSTLLPTLIPAARSLSLTGATPTFRLTVKPHAQSLSLSGQTAVIVAPASTSVPGTASVSDTSASVALADALAWGATLSDAGAWSAEVIDEPV